MAADLRSLVRSAAVVITVLVPMLVPIRAWAHAALVESEPRAGSELSVAPGVVSLSFTEPLNESLSRAVVIAPDSERFEGAAAEGGAIRVPLATDQPGIYRVEWTTVSILDGHLLEGSLAFGVGVAPPDGAAIVVSGPRAVDLGVSLLRGIENVALLLALGSLLLRRLSRREPPVAWVHPPIRRAILVAAVAGSLVVLAEALVASRGSSLSSLWSYLSTGSAGAARVARLGAEWIAVVVARRAPLWAGVCLVGAAASLAAAGHAAASEPRWFAVVVDAAHVVAAGLWAGGVLALALVRPPDGWRGSQGRGLLNRFTPVALLAFAVTVATGIVRAAEELSTLSDLVRTSYGIVLLSKILAVVVMVQLSVFGWRRIVGSLRAEATIAVVVVALAALLAAYPLPPARIAETRVEEERPQRSLALPRQGELTLGANAGQFLIGFTLRPGEPGSNEVLVYLLPLDGEEAAAGVPVTLTVGGRATRMTDCGSACRRAEVELAGGQEVEVRIGSPVGGTATIPVPTLPAPRAGRTLRAAQAAMHGLRSYRMTEKLSSGLADVVARYMFEAPDRARIDVRQGSSSVFLGTRRYIRPAPDAPWHLQRGPPLAVPSLTWDSFGPWSAPHAVGTARVGGERTTVIAFFGTSADVPAWFRLWVTEEGRVLRAQMRAQGHFMDQRFFAFDRPVSIEAPAEA